MDPVRLVEAPARCPRLRAGRGSARRRSARRGRGTRDRRISDSPSPGSGPRACLPPGSGLRDAPRSCGVRIDSRFRSSWPTPSPRSMSFAPSSSTSTEIGRPQQPVESPQPARGGVARDPGIDDAIRQSGVVDLFLDQRRKGLGPHGVRSPRSGSCRRKTTTGRSISEASLAAAAGSLNSGSLPAPCIGFASRVPVPSPDGHPIPRISASDAPRIARR